MTLFYFKRDKVLFVYFCVTTCRVLNNVTVPLIHKLLVPSIVNDTSIYFGPVHSTLRDVMLTSIRQPLYECAPLIQSFGLGTSPCWQQNITVTVFLASLGCLIVDVSANTTIGDFARLWCSLIWLLLFLESPDGGINLDQLASPLRVLHGSITDALLMTTLTMTLYHGLYGPPIKAKCGEVKQQDQSFSETNGARTRQLDRIFAADGKSKQEKDDDRANLRAFFAAQFAELERREADRAAAGAAFGVQQTSEDVEEAVESSSNEAGGGEGALEEQDSHNLEHRGAGINRYGHPLPVTVSAKPLGVRDHGAAVARYGVWDGRSPITVPTAAQGDLGPRVFPMQGRVGEETDTRPSGSSTTQTGAMPGKTFKAKEFEEEDWSKAFGNPGPKISKRMGPSVRDL